MSIAARIKKYFRVVDEEVCDLMQGENAALQTALAQIGLDLRQTQFLLNQAPLMNLPEDILSGAHAAGTKYVYAHPNTIRQVPGSSRNFSATRRTQWVENVALPEGTVIFSNNAMPGLEKSNA